MGNVGDIERITQNRVVKLFKEKLGYTYLGNWEDRTNNSNIEEELLIRYLTKKGYNQTLITKALYELGVAANNYNESLYTNNKNVYTLLRYGVQIKTEAGETFEPVQLFTLSLWKAWYRTLYVLFPIMASVSLSIIPFLPE